MTRRMSQNLVLALTVLLTAGRANAGVVVTFYTDEASFLAAISPQAAFNFEGITTETGSHNFGASYHTGSVTFTSPHGPFFNDMLVVGKHSQTLGSPFDSALLIPDATPSLILATFDAGTKVTAVGGHIMNLYAAEDFGIFTLTGSTGVLDVRSALMGLATTGKRHSFFGYTVEGDTISSLSVNTPRDAPAVADFTYGVVVPEPATLTLLGVGIAGMAGYWRRKKQHATA